MRVLLSEVSKTPKIIDWGPQSLWEMEKGSDRESRATYKCVTRALLIDHGLNSLANLQTIKQIKDMDDFATSWQQLMAGISLNECVSNV